MGLILGGIVEENLRRSISYYGSFSECLVQPSIGTVMFALAVIIVLASVFFAIRRARKEKAAETEQA